MKKIDIYHILCVVFVLALIQTAFVSCINEEEYNKDGSVVLKFSEDTISFDTIFTTMGSVTKKITVHNRESEAIKIDRISLGAGAMSYFRFNADGDSGAVVNNVEIGAKDSIMIFVRVELEPNNDNNPLLIQDSLVFTFNGKQQNVQLLAYGQDAYYHKPEPHSFYNQTTGEYTTLSCSLASDTSAGSGVELNGTEIVWKTDKPHVVVGSCVLAGNYTLNLESGTRIHMANNSGLTVLSGATLKAMGSLNEPVLFTSVRTQGRYSDIAGQWNGVYLSAGSKNNEMNYCTIKNAIIGLTVDTCVTQRIDDNNFSAPTLKIGNSTIENNSVYGMYLRGAVVDGYNLIVQNSGSYNVGLAMGGNYRFVYCTFVNYWFSNSTRNDATLVLNDWYKAQGGVEIVRPLYNAEFHNCVIYGNLASEEIEFDLKQRDNIPYSFDHCLLKTSLFSNTSSFSNMCLFNLDPKFKDVYENDVNPTSDSPLIGNADGNWNYMVPMDIYNNYRGTYPTIGAVEYSGETYSIMAKRQKHRKSGR